jgi:hypothetical protein
MATLAQLQAEPWWNREIVTPELAGLGDELRRRTGRPADAYGTKGNTAHLRGGHRSQEWILNSAFCTSRTYTVQSGLTAEQLRHIAACDWTPGDWGTAANRALMVAITKRVLAALRAGQLDGVREVIGTLDGSTVYAYRYDGTTFSADTSHLDHLHLTFDRRRMRDSALMAKVADTITGDDMQLTDVVFTETLADGKTVQRTVGECLRIMFVRTGYIGNTWIPQFSAELRASLAEILKAANDDPTTTVTMTDADQDALVDGLVSGVVAQLDVPTPAEIADAVVDEQHARLAE